MMLLFLVFFPMAAAVCSYLIGRKDKKLRDRAVRIVMQALNCGRERAQELLGACDGNVKAAIVCGETGCGAQTAERALDACQGFVRRAIAQVQDEK